jgi:Tfp pilus assembly protein PilW
MKTPWHDTRGLTLTELVIVMALATVVILGLTTFYFQSQTTWLDGSTQALAQQDATLITEDLGTWIHQSAIASVNTADPLHHQLILLQSDGVTEAHRFQWDPTDSLLEEGLGAALAPMSNSKVMRFQVTTVGDSVISLDMLEVKSADGKLVQMSSAYAMYGRP